MQPVVSLSVQFAWQFTVSLSVQVGRPCGCWASPTAEWALAGGLTLFCSIIGKQAGWILSTSLRPEVASGQSGEDHWSWERPTAE